MKKRLGIRNSLKKAAINLMDKILGKIQLGGVIKNKK